MLVNLTEADIRAIAMAREALATQGGKPGLAEGLASAEARIEERRKGMAAPSDEPFLKLTTTVSDWRIADAGPGAQADDGLLDDLPAGHHRQAWTIQVSQQAANDSLWIVARAPDGTERSLSLEVDRGNLCASAFCQADDALLRIAIGDATAHVRDEHTYGRGAQVETQVLTFDGESPPRWVPGDFPAARLEGAGDGEEP